MNKETLKALKESIAHWEKHVDGLAEEEEDQMTIAEHLLAIADELHLRYIQGRDSPDWFESLIRLGEGDTHSSDIAAFRRAAELAEQEGSHG